jgi:CheY-like chemotaxis protein
MQSDGASSPAVAGLRLLVVEDELMISMLVEDMLAELGYQVVAVAATIEEASRLASEAEVDGALLDVNLNGKKVDTVAQALLGRNIPFIFTTGYGQQGVPDAFRDRPTLQKPYQIEQLGEALARALKK